ncbi:uncharacterized protein VSU04_010794 isoform 1-T2 [Chlamydotis macqueenii]
MERPRHRLRLRLPRLPRLVAAAVLVECCAWLCPGLGTGTGPVPATAVPCQRCRTDPERGAGTTRAPRPGAAGQLWTEAELLPFPGTPTGTAEPPGTQGSPGSLQTGGEGTELATQDEAATEHPGVLLSAGASGVTSVGAPASVEPGTAPAARYPPGTDPVGNVTAEGASTTQGTPSPSLSSATGSWGSLSILPGWSPVGDTLVHSRRGSHGPSSPEPRAGEGLAATVPLGDISPGTRLGVTLATDSPTPGTVGTSPFVGGLQSLLTPTAGGTAGPGLAGGRGSDSRRWHGTDVAWQGPHSVLRPSLLSLEAGGRGGPVANTAQPAMGTDPTLLPAGGRGSNLPVLATVTSTPGPGGALDPTTRMLGPPDTEGPPEHSHVPLDQTWHPSAVPVWPPASVAPGSVTAAQSRVPYTSPGSPRVPLSPQPARTGVSAVPTSLTPQPSPGTSRGVLGLGPTAGTPLAGLSPGPWLPHTGSEGDPAESSQILGRAPVGVSEAGPWAGSAPPSWHPGSLVPAPGAPRQPAPSQPASFLGPTTAIGVTTATTVTATAVTAAAATTATGSSALLEDAGTVMPEPRAAVLQGDAAGLTWGPPTHLPTVVPGPPRQPTDLPGTLGHPGGPGSPPAAGDADLVQPSSSPGGGPDADTPRATPAPAPAGRAPRVFIVEDQPPLLRASLLRVPCQLVLDMRFVPALQDPGSREHRALLHSFNRTVAPLFTSVPGFLRLEVTGIREGSVVLDYDALFAAERVRAPGLGALLDAALGSGGARPGLAVGTAPVLRNVALERLPDPCAELFACRPGFACVAGAGGNATCTSLCHRDYCKNHGICTHGPERGPVCQCPVGSDFWFVGLRCDYRVTRQSLLGAGAGVLLSIVLLGAVLAAAAFRRFKALLLEARADQTRSSYRRFCRLDDVSAQYWSRSWLPSASSLDNPAFSNSEELLHLQILDNGCCGCREGSGTADGSKQRPAPAARPDCRPSFHYDWDTSSSSMNDPMVDSGKASDISVSSWPMEPSQWAPFPLLHQLSRQRTHRARRPHSYCEGMELGTLERSWTA